MLKVSLDKYSLDYSDVICSTLVRSV